MKTFDGYKKRTLTDSNLLLASGGDKPLSDFIGTLNWDSTNRKLQYKKVGDTNWNDLVTLGSNALNSTAYLPLSGGTISNSSNHVPLTIYGTLYYSAIRLSTKDSEHYRTFGIRSDGELFVTNDHGRNAEYKIYHEGNKPTYSDVGAAAAYHTHILGGRNLLAGTTMDEKTFTYNGGEYEDKMTWTTTIPLFGYKYVLSFWAKSTVDKDSIGAHFYDPNTTTLYKTSLGESYFASDGRCDITLSTSWERYWICYDLTRTEAKKSVILPRLWKGNVQGTISIKGVKFEMGEFPTDWSPAPEDLTKTLTFTGYSTSTYNGTGAVTVAIPNNTNLLTNGANFITASSDITGNAATATKLQTSRTLWGQTFDGSASVSGNMTGIGSITPTTDNSYNIGTSSTQFLWVYANGIYAKSGSWFGLGANNTDHIRITTDGNVGIGTTSPSYKLHVNGIASATRLILSGFDNYQSSGGLVMNNSDIWGLNAIYTSDLAESATEGYQFKRSDGNYDSIWAKNGIMYFSPNGSPDSGYSTNYKVLNSNNYTEFTVTKAGDGASGTWGINITGNADTVDGLHVHTGRNNEANKIVRTDGSGYIQAGWINTTSGDMGTTAATRIYCSNDGYIRYKTLANFSSDIAGQLYWANVKVSTSSNAYTTPQFGNVTICDGTNSYLYLKTAGSYAYLAGYNTGGQYGADVVLQSGSAMVLGAGESAEAMHHNNIDSLQGTENLYLTADWSVKIFTNCDSIGNRKYVACFDTSGYTYFNSYINIGGHEKNASSPTYVWGSNASDNFLRSYQTSSLSVNYANSAGSASTATKLSSDAGSATKPIYFTGGVPTACTYSLSATVNSGTDGKLAYYNVSNTISSYTATVGGVSSPVYISSGVPAKCTFKLSSVTWLNSSTGSVYVYQYGPIVIVLGKITKIGSLSTYAEVFKYSDSIGTPYDSIGFTLAQHDGKDKDRNTVLYCSSSSRTFKVAKGYSSYTPSSDNPFYFTCTFITTSY